MCKIIVCFFLSPINGDSFTSFTIVLPNLSTEKKLFSVNVYEVLSHSGKEGEKWPTYINSKTPLTFHGKDYTFLGLV